MADYRIGIDVGGTKLAYGLFDKNFELIEKLIEKTPAHLPAQDMMEQMCGRIEELLKKNGLQKGDLRGVGAAFPGHINAREGLVMASSNLPLWKGVPLQKNMERLLGIPVIVDNDANAAALAEHYLGAGKGRGDMIYVTISTGIGAGLILDGKLYRGTYGAAGELGHMYIGDVTGLRCGCGRTGCIEAVASGTGMVKYVRKRLAEGVESLISSLAGCEEKITPLQVGQAYEQGDALARETLEFCAQQLGYFFYNLYQIFNVGTIVYGGGVSNLGEPLFGRVQARFRELMPLSEQYPMEFLPARFVGEVGIVGAATLVE
jgi:glucokinase